jgi:hypothetical protein
MDSRQQSAGMTKVGQPCPELGRRVASLYQDKEDSMKVNTNQGKAYKDSVLELLDIYNWEPLRLTQCRLGVAIGYPNAIVRKAYLS